MFIFEPFYCEKHSEMYNLVRFIVLSVIQQKWAGNMRDLDYNATLEKLFTPSIVATLTKIHEGKGILPLASVTGQDTLEKLNEIAKTRDAGASCRLEGIKVTEKHLRELLEGKEKANTDADKAVLAYRSVLETIDNSYSTLRISPAIILQLHSDLFRYSSEVKSIGKWRGGDRARAASYGQTSFMPQDGPARYHGIATDLVSAPDVPAMMRELCNAYNNALKDNVYSPLLASIIFLLDFICIHPFDMGTGEMARLLAILMFDKTGFTVGRYISIDAEIEATQDEYFESMKESAKGWDQADNDYTPFVEYMLGVILRCYDELSERTSALSVRGSNEKTIRHYFQSIDEPVSKIEILEANPMMSQKTLERILQKMQKEHSIEKVGAARATRYQRVVRQIPM